MTDQRCFTIDEIRVTLKRILKDARTAQGTAEGHRPISGLTEFSYRLLNEAANDLFEPLFVLATNMTEGDSYGVWELAGKLLVAIEPPCPRSCDDAMRLLEAGDWQVSDCYVPFYLAMQFGKRAVHDSALQVARESRARGGRGLCEAVALRMQCRTFCLVGDSNLKLLAVR